MLVHDLTKKSKNMLTFLSIYLFVYKYYFLSLTKPGIGWFPGMHHFGAWISHTVFYGLISSR
ncbi:unnamed protein product [Brassica rapa]|uniref:Uncharacterized protein n=1 Tax=Brassica campestris TaxID=3711 RepID=A0A8D9CX22_BRACM|nr:unnamed protein product [Brassica rapa]